MAKYTELFSEYLERGGQLPASFALIDGFEDLSNCIIAIRKSASKPRRFSS